MTFGLLMLASCKSEKNKENLAGDVKEVVVDTIHDTVYMEAPRHEILVKPLTQYALVEVSDYGASFRDASKLKSILRKLGFKVNTNFRRPDDEMEDYTILTAKRSGANGQTTSIELCGGEDIVCYINFADLEETEAFVESMRKSAYKKSGNTWYNPHNVAGLSQIGVKVNGTKVTIMYPFEMFPINF